MCIRDLDAHKNFLTLSVLIAPYTEVVRVLNVMPRHSLNFWSSFRCDRKVERGLAVLVKNDQGEGRLFHYIRLQRFRFNIL